MESLKKPKSIEDLPVPFDKIGDEGWAENCRQILTAYGVPLSAPISKYELEVLEIRIGYNLPESYWDFMLELGDLEIDAFNFLHPSKVKTLRPIWFRNFLSPVEQQRLGQLISLIDPIYSDDVYAIDLKTNVCCYCSHDPAQISDCHSSFDNLVKLAFLNLPIGYYGWPDEYLEELVFEASKSLYIS